MPGYGRRSATEQFTIELIQSQFDQGRVDAQQDAFQGTRKLYVQTRGAWGRFLVDLMRDRYDVIVEHVGDMTTAEETSYERGYNSITSEFLDSSCGEGTMKKIWAEVDEFRTELYRKHFGNDQSSD